MKYNKVVMTKLINEHRELHDEMKQLKQEMGLDKNTAVKALYHSRVADSGPYMDAYKEIENSQK